MSKLAFMLSFILLPSCANDFAKDNTDNPHYFTDALQCYNASLNKIDTKVTTANSMTVVQVPLSLDESRFGQCLEQAGYATEQVDMEKYRKVARTCSKQARNSLATDDAYARCVRQETLPVTVDLVPSKAD